VRCGRSRHLSGSALRTESGVDGMTDSKSEEFSMRDSRNQTDKDLEFRLRMESYFGRSLGTNVDKLWNFTKYVPRQELARFLAKHALFEKVLHVHGHIIECGVYLGAGLMTWAQLSAIFEPVNHIRRLVGFDTFTGFPGLSDKDKSDDVVQARPGGLATHAYDDLMECLQLYDLNRPVGHIPRVELEVGNAMETIPTYLQKNPHVVVAMLYLDFDLYEPTKLAIESFLPRMPKGAILAFDELDQAVWPGETLALLDTIGIRNLRIERFPYNPQLSYAVLD